MPVMPVFHLVHNNKAVRIISTRAARTCTYGQWSSARMLVTLRRVFFTSTSRLSEPAVPDEAVANVGLDARGPAGRKGLLQRGWGKKTNMLKATWADNTQHGSSLWRHNLPQSKYRQTIWALCFTGVCVCVCVCASLAICICVHVCLLNAICPSASLFLLPFPSNCWMWSIQAAHSSRKSIENRRASIQSAA